jgi:hypothetical protein
MRKVTSASRIGLELLFEALFAQRFLHMPFPSLSLLN